MKMKIRIVMTKKLIRLNLILIIIGVIITIILFSLNRKILRLTVKNKSGACIEY